MTTRWKAVEQYFTVALFNFQFYPVCNFKKFISFGLGAVRNERVNCRVNKSGFHCGNRPPPIQFCMTTVFETELF